MPVTQNEVKVILSAVDQMSPVLKQAEQSVGSLGSRLQASAASLASAGAQLSLGVTAPLAGMAVAAGKAFMDYQSNLNMFQAVTGATADQMSQVGQLAKDLGADMALPATSAGDAAAAMTELGKAGLSVADSMAAARGVLQLSAAGGLSNAEAATVAANALNAFHLQGSEATRVSDLLAAAANASSAEVKDLALSMQAGSAVFASAGIPIQDMVTAIGEMANAGIKGQDAGTSLKTMLLSLEAPSKAAKEQMQAMGVQIYDASGAMVPFRSIIEQFSGALAGMTQQQRDSALATIFGSDAVRAANIIMGGGVAAFDQMQAAVTRGGAASELAGSRMKGLGGALAGLQSTLESVGIALFEPLAGALEGIVRAAADLVAQIPNIPGPILAMAGTFAVVLAAAGPLLLVLGGLAAAAAFLISPIGLIVVAVAALAAAFVGAATSIPAFASALGEAGQIAQDTFTTIQQVFSGDWAPDPSAIQPFTEAVGELAQVVQQALSGDVAGAFQSFVALVQSVGAQLAAQLQAWGASFVAWIGPAAAQMLAQLNIALNQLFAWIAANAVPLAQQLLAWGTEFWQWVVAATPLLLAQLAALGQQLLAWIGQNVAPIVQTLLQWGLAFVQWVAPQIPVLLVELAKLSAALIEWLIGTALPEIVIQLAKWGLAFGQWVVPATAEMLGQLPGLIGELVGWIGGTAAPAAASAAIQIGTSLIGGVLQGLAGFGSRIGSALADGLRQAVGQGQAAIGAGSPSQLTADELGTPMVEGIVVGIQNGTGAVGTAIRAVVEAAIRNGIDPLIALSLAKAESEFNPLASGDFGTSTGLFQLRRPGQGSGFSTAQLQDPFFNAQQFLSSHAALFQQLVGQGLTGRDLAIAFGGQAEVSAREFWHRYGEAFDALAPTVQPIINRALAGQTEQATTAQAQAVTKSVALVGPAIRTAVTDTGELARQMDVFNRTMAQTPPNVVVATTALGQMQNALGPVLRSVDQGTMSADQLATTLVQLAASTGLAVQPWQDLQAGLIPVDVALNQTISQIADSIPIFGTLDRTVSTTGHASAQSALDFLQLLASWQKAPAQAQTAATAIGKVDDALDAVGGGAKNVGPGGATKDASPLLTSLQKLPADVQALVPQAEAALGQLSTVVESALVQLSANVVNQIDQLSSELNAKLDAEAQAAGEAARRIGEAIDRGIVDGIQSGAGEIESAAREAAQAALEAARSELGIGSPSKRAADEIGLPIVQGIAQGIRGGRAGVGNALEGVLGGYGPMRGAGAGYGGAPRPLIDTLLVHAPGTSPTDVKAMVREIMWELQSEMTALERMNRR